MKLTPQQVAQIAKLARLQLSPAEKAQYQDQLSTILDYVDQLQSVSVDGVPEADAARAGSPLRPDVAKPLSPEHLEALRQTMPKRLRGYLEVKGVFADKDTAL